MKVLSLYALIGIYCMSTISNLYGQSLEIESSSQGIFVPKLNNSGRDAVPINMDNEGMLIFNLNSGFLEKLNHAEVAWQQINPGVASTVNGIDGSNGPIGPEGPRGMARAGAAGPDLGDLIFQCWDFNHNGILDSAEDLNNDGMGTNIDCRGNTGPQGPAGPQGLDAKVVHNFTHTVIAGTNLIFGTTFFSGLMGLTPASKVFVVGLNYNEPVFIRQDGFTFTIITVSGNFIPNGTQFNVIYTE